MIKTESSIFSSDAEPMEEDEEDLGAPAQKQPNEYKDYTVSGKDAVVTYLRQQSLMSLLSIL